VVFRSPNLAMEILLHVAGVVVVVVVILAKSCSNVTFLQFSKLTGLNSKQVLRLDS
jgi:uncharacterized membrane protein